MGAGRRGPAAAHLTLSGPGAGQLPAGGARPGRVRRQGTQRGRRPAVRHQFDTAAQECGHVRLGRAPRLGECPRDPRHRGGVLFRSSGVGAEHHHERRAVRVEQDGAAVEVSVGEPAGVQVGHHPRDAGEHRHRVRPGQRSAEGLVERRAGRLRGPQPHLTVAVDDVADRQQTR
jgi:hypothetical protein